MDQCIWHSEAVRRGASNTFIIGDTPFLSYRVSVPEAVRNAGRLHKDAGVDAMAIEQAGAFALLAEAVPAEVCGIIRRKLGIPVYSSGAGWEADGQFMICSDVLGIFQTFTPKFVRRYENQAEKTDTAFKQYAQDARSGQFPRAEHAYRMVDGELPKLKQLLGE